MPLAELAFVVQCPFLCRGARSPGSCSSAFIVNDLLPKEYTVCQMSPNFD